LIEFAGKVVIVGFVTILSTFHVNLLWVVMSWWYQLSCSTPGLVTTWMGDCLLAGKPSRYITNHLGQLSLPSLQGRLIESCLAVVKEELYLFQPFTSKAQCHLLYAHIM